MDHVGQLQIGAKTATWESPSALWTAEHLGCRTGWRRCPGVWIELPPHMWIWGTTVEEVPVAVAAVVMVVVATVVVLFPLFFWKNSNSQVMYQSL